MSSPDQQICNRTLEVLSASKGLSLGETARAIGASVSGTRKSYQRLMGDGLVIQSGKEFRLAPTPLARAMLEAVDFFFEPLERLRLTAAGCESIEFVGRKEKSILVIFARGSDPLAESRVARRIEKILESAQFEPTYKTHDEIRRSLKEDPANRNEYLEYLVIFGNPEASFVAGGIKLPSSSVPLGQINPLVPPVSRRTGAALRSSYGIKTATVFGSAVRDDFGPGSDLDISIETKNPLKLREITSLEEEFERIFGRDVDLIINNHARGSVQQAVAREGVRLF